jgi:hypothetical protein
VLQAEVRLLEAERQRLLRELALNGELEEGYARRGAAQGAALKQANVRWGEAEARGRGASAALACVGPAVPVKGVAATA